MAAPKLSAKGFADFLVGSPSQKRKILRNYKFADQGEGKGRSNYYVRAVAAIRAYHRADNDPDKLQEAISKIEQQLPAAGQLKKANLSHNIRAINAYQQHFGKRKF